MATVITPMSGGSMNGQEITWGWAIRVFLGILWRWVKATVLATFAFAFIVVIVARIIGQPGLRHDPIFPKILIAVWLLLFFWAFKTGLASKLERFSVDPVSIDDRQSIEPRNEPVRIAIRSKSWNPLGWRIAGWILLAAAAFFFSIPATNYLDHQLKWRLSWRILYLTLAAVDIVSAWVVGLLSRRASWKQHVLVILGCALLPAVHYLFMLTFGCGIWNTLAGHYKCGL